MTSLNFHGGVPVGGKIVSPSPRKPTRPQPTMAGLVSPPGRQLPDRPGYRPDGKPVNKTTIQKILDAIRNSGPQKPTRPQPTMAGLVSPKPQPDKSFIQRILDAIKNSAVKKY